MAVTLSDKFPTFHEKIIRSIKSYPPIGGSEYRFVAVNGEDVGASFEPRIKVVYDVYLKKRLLGKYSSTFVFEKNLDFVTTVNSDWTMRKA